MIKGLSADTYKALLSGHALAMIGAITMFVMILVALY